MSPVRSIPIAPQALSGKQQAVTSTHFYQRARHYRFAAAVTDNERDIAMFSDLGAMFEALARAFQRVEENRR
jgi:hypothetical protein